MNTLIIIIFLSFAIDYTCSKTPANNDLPVLFFEFWQKKKPLYNTGGSCILGYLLVHCNLPVHRLNRFLIRLLIFMKEIIDC